MLFNLSKLFYVLFLFYVGWGQAIFSAIPRIPTFLGIGMMLFFILYTLQTKKEISILITSPLYIWLFFAFYLLFSGIFVAKDTGHLVRSLFTYAQTLILMVYIINISAIEKNNDFFVKSYLLYSIVYMLTMLFWGYETHRGVLMLAKNSNPNGDGLTLLAGIFCALLLLKNKNISHFIITLVIVGLFFYTIMLTASRKSFIAAMLLIFLWIFFVFKEYWKKFAVSKKVISFFVLGIIILLAIYNFLPWLFDTTLFTRLTTEGYTISADIARTSMYRDAIDFLYKNPLFGIGFNHFRILSRWQTYSHSTYAEVISNAGIVGTIIYFSAYFIIIFNLYYIFKKARGTIISIKALQYIMLMFIMIVLGTGVIHFYGVRDSVLFSLMISFYYIEKNKIIKYKNVNEKEITTGKEYTIE